ncbi:MAG TPA: Gfo/Idh/MocA family oxidoreductase [Acidobacteriaceae bacterium]|jgi:predicted dehydrogenase|nr:Gfo/Idh/MocA family oxidoreductase [Acidobacteriaceae bacterium]
MIRVGLVGFGMAGRVFHAPLITAVEGFALAAVVERSSRNAEAAYPGIATYPSLTAMLGDSTLDLIVVITPDNWHVPHATEALKAGRHVIVDKPMASTAAEIAGLMALAAKSGKLLMPFHNRRWDSDFRTLQKLLHEEKLGRVVGLESTFDRWRPQPRLAKWQEDGSTPGGVLTNLGTHLADQALALSEFFGMPEAIGAEVGIERDGGAMIDLFTVRLHYPRLTITLGSNYLAAQPRPRFHIRGTQGNFVKWGLDPQEALLNETGCVVEPDWGMEPAENWGTLAVEPADDPIVSMITYPVPPVPGDYRLYYAGVRDAILGKARPPVQAIDAWRVARLLEWAQQSSAERRTIPCDWTQKPSAN